MVAPKQFGNRVQHTNNNKKTDIEVIINNLNQINSDLLIIYENIQYIISSISKLTSEKIDTNGIQTSIDAIKSILDSVQGVVNIDNEKILNFQKISNTLYEIIEKYSSLKDIGIAYSDRIINMISGILECIEKIDKIDINPNIIDKINIILDIVKTSILNVVKIVGYILLLAPISFLLIPAAPVIMMGLVILGGVMSSIFKFFKNVLTTSLSNLISFIFFTRLILINIDSLILISNKIIELLYNIPSWIKWKFFVKPRLKLFNKLIVKITEILTSLNSVGKLRVSGTTITNLVIIRVIIHQFGLLIDEIMILTKKAILFVIFSGIIKLIIRAQTKLLLSISNYVNYAIGLLGNIRTVDFGTFVIKTKLLKLFIETILDIMNEESRLASKSIKLTLLSGIIRFGLRSFGLILRIIVSEISIILKGLSVKNVILGSISIKIMIGVIETIMFNVILLSPILMLFIPAGLIMLAGVLMLRLIIYAIRGSISLKSVIGAQLIVASIVGLIVSFIALGASLIVLAGIATILATLVDTLLLFLVVVLVGMVAIRLLSKHPIDSVLKATIIITLSVISFSMLLILSYVILNLGLSSASIIPLTGSIFGFLLIVTGLTLALAAYGALGQLLLPLILASVVLTTAMLLAIGSVILITKMLELLQRIKLDSEAIRNNVKDVMTTCGMVVESVLGGEENEHRWKYNRNGLLGYLVRALAPQFSAVIDSITASVTLVGYAISIMLVLAMAGMLRLLQTLKLDRSRISGNIDAVLDTCSEISSKIFGDSNTTIGTKTKDIGLLQGIIGLVAPQFNMILDAFASSAILIGYTIGIGSILIMAGLLRLLGNLDTNKILEGRENATVVLSVASEITNSIMGGTPKTSEKSDQDTGLVKFLSSFVKGVANIISSIFALAYLAPMVISISAILLLSHFVKLLSKISEEDLSNGRKRAIDVIDAGRSIMDQIIRPNSNDSDITSKESWLGGLLHKSGLGIALEIIPAILAIGYVAAMIGAIALVNVLAKSLEKLSKLDYEIETAKSNAIVIVGAGQDMMDILMSGSDSLGGEKSEKTNIFTKLLNWVGTVGDVAGALAQIGKLAVMNIAIGSISKLADQINMISQYDVVVSDAKKHTNDIIDTAQAIVERLSETNWGNVGKITDKLEVIEKTGNSLRSFSDGLTSESVQYSKDITDNYIKFLDKVDSVDIKKLETTEKMLASWAKLSESIQGNFEGLANVINEHILPALEELNETMTKVTDQLDVQSNQTIEIAQAAYVQRQRMLPAEDVAQGKYVPSARETAENAKKQLQNIQTQAMAKLASGNGSLSVSDILLSGIGKIKIENS